LQNAATLRRHLGQDFEEYFTVSSEEQISNYEHRTYLKEFESPVRKRWAETVHNAGAKAYARYFLMEPAVITLKYLGDEASCSLYAPIQHHRLSHELTFSLVASPGSFLRV
jgi:hypothetical protein